MNRYRKLRIVLASLFVVAITVLFLDFTGVTHAYLGWMAHVQLLPAILALNVAVVALLLVLTLLFGRLYCSVICPLGVMQDLFARLGRKAKRNRYGYSKPKQWLRVSVLVLFVVLMSLGVYLIELGALKFKSRRIHIFYVLLALLILSSSLAQGSDCCTWLLLSLPLSVSMPLLFVRAEGRFSMVVYLALVGLTVISLIG